MNEYMDNACVIMEVDEQNKAKLWESMVERASHWNNQSLFINREATERFVSSNMDDEFVKPLLEAKCKDLEETRFKSRTSFFSDGKPKLKALNMGKKKHPYNEYKSTVIRAVVAGLDMYKDGKVRPFLEVHNIINVGNHDLTSTVVTPEDMRKRVERSQKTTLKRMDELQNVNGSAAQSEATSFITELDYRYVGKS